MFFKSATDFERALHWLFRALVKNQRHPVAGWNFNQAAGGVSVLNLLGRTNGLSQFINRRALFVNRKLGIADDVDEQDMGDLELDLFLDLNGHGRVSADWFGAIICLSFAQVEAKGARGRDAALRRSEPEWQRTSQRDVPTFWSMTSAWRGLSTAARSDE